MYLDLLAKHRYQFVRLRALGVLLLILSQAACGTGPVVKEQIKIDLEIEASKDVNTTDRGLAAPIMVRVYELKSGTTFEAADFFSLQRDGKSLLAADLLATDEFILRPDSNQLIKRKAHPETTTIGVIAGFRELGKSVWRATYRLEPAPEARWYRAAIPANKAKLKIDIHQQAISITKLD
ncbi:type VI secretion system lipoprotein TssJ [Glaciimonas immobilis]|nr:type VI secretion system lipoprotein TssJ [Glaciimonas immobilis]